MRKKLGSVLLALLLTLSLITGALAAEPAGLRLAAEQSGSEITLTVWLTAPGATNGRVAVEYDARQLSLQSAVQLEGAVKSVNDETPGEVGLAWVGGNLGDQETRVAVLTFRSLVDTVSSIVISAELTELYDSGAVVTVETTEDSVTLRDGDIPVQPGPGGPVDDDEPGEDEEPGDDEEPGEDTTPSGPRHPFTDIIGHWAEDEIADAWEQGLVNGTSATTFSPELAITRGQFVTLLYRLAGEPAVSGTTPFVDVAADVYYAPAVNWAYNTGVVNGTSATTFSPDAAVTRQELVTMLHRYAQTFGMDTSASAALSGFADAAAVADWAVEAMQWAVGAGIIQGADGQLLPTANTTRAQAAAILVRFAG